MKAGAAADWVDAGEGNAAIMELSSGRRTKAGRIILEIPGRRQRFHPMNSSLQKWTCIKHLRQSTLCSIVALRLILRHQGL